MVKIIFLFVLLLNPLLSEDFYYNGEKKIPLAKVENNTNNTLRDLSTTIYYKTQQGVVLGVTDEIIIKLKDPNTLESLLKKYNFTLTKELFTNTYLIKVATKEETLQIANQLHNESGVVYATPNFIKTMKKR